MYRDDATRLRHMLDSAQDAIRFAGGRTRESLEGDRLLVLGRVKSIEIVGEAATRVGEATRGRYPAIPWANIVAMRNRLVHVYFDVDLDQVWRTVVEDLPPLIRQLQRALEQEGKAEGHR